MACGDSSVDVWTTTDQKSALRWSTTDLFVGPHEPDVFVNTSDSRQALVGFGFSLTGGSAQVISALPADQRVALLQELFGSNENSISLSYLRISIGASDLDQRVFSYDDIEPGDSDFSLNNFTLAADEVHLLPLLREIKTIAPTLRLLGTPWSAPAWMKTNNDARGGELKADCMHVYAHYLVRYLKEMQRLGLALDAVTVQNEPLNGSNTPSMVMAAGTQAVFVKSHLGPALFAASLDTKVLVWDHNCDEPEYPISILNDEDAKAYVHGSAFHLYAGDITAMSDVHDAHPDRAVYFTEQWTSSDGDFGPDLAWGVKNVLIGSLRNWSQVVLMWNLATDAVFGPHTPGGCDSCLGGLTVDGNEVTRNVAYYIVAHASKAVPAGSFVVHSATHHDALSSVAFSTADGHTALTVLNSGLSFASFTVSDGRAWFQAGLPAGAVGTFKWL